MTPDTPPAPLMCANDGHPPNRAVFRVVTWPDGRPESTAACLSCALLIVVPEAYDERQSVLLEVVDGD